MDRSQFEFERSHSDRFGLRSISDRSNSLVWMAPLITSSPCVEPITFLWMSHDRCRSLLLRESCRVCFLYICSLCRSIIEIKLPKIYVLCGRIWRTFTVYRDLNEKLQHEICNFNSLFITFDKIFYLKLNVKSNSNNLSCWTKTMLRLTRTFWNILYL